VIAIILIIKKVHPAYCLILGALVGGIIGGGGLSTTVSTMSELRGDEAMDYLKMYSNSMKFSPA